LPSWLGAVTANSDQVMNAPSSPKTMNEAENARLRIDRSIADFEDPVFSLLTGMAQCSKKSRALQLVAEAPGCTIA
jgi:hypothetical protein